jgi:hypothetical protein
LKPIVSHNMRSKAGDLLFRGRGSKSDLFDFTGNVVSIHLSARKSLILGLGRASRAAAHTRSQHSRQLGVSRSSLLLPRGFADFLARVRPRQAEMAITDDNGDEHVFFFETFSNTHDVLTLIIYWKAPRCAGGNSGADDPRLKREDSLWHEPPGGCARNVRSDSMTTSTNLLRALNSGPRGGDRRIVHLRSQWQLREAHEHVPFGSDCDAASAALRCRDYICLTNPKTARWDNFARLGAHPFLRYETRGKGFGHDGRGSAADRA